MKKTLILASFLALAPFAKGQLLLEALEGGIPFTPSEKCLERVYDKHYGDGEHNFIYCAVMGPGNKKWLNLNLGAEYAREGSIYFNPEAVPTDDNDWKAFGSLYNYNRDSDGHELVQYRRGTSKWEVKHKNGHTSYRPNAGTESNIVAAIPRYYTEWESSNDPCPNGYHVVDSSILVGTAGYHVTGRFNGTSIIKHNSFTNWTLVTAPSWYVAAWPESDKYMPSLYKMTEDGYLVTNAYVIDDRTGTSDLWLRYAVPSTTAYSNGTWRNISTSINPDYTYTPVIDRGIRSGAEYDFGATRGLSSVSAVRCVEK